MKIRGISQIQRVIFSPTFQIYALIVLAVIVRLLWISFTDFIDEDAFITFRFARQIASGNGFVYNPGERLYGTTTPLFTLLLSLWLLMFQNSITEFARVFGILAALGSLFFVAKSLEKLRVSHPQKIFIMVLLILASKFWRMETSGMETPLIICLMSASWYSVITRKPTWTGILCGLLLWTRIDLILWVMVLIVFAAWSNPKRGARIILVTALTYLPWLLFATAYFGSPIPHTITAKWVAYFEHGRQFEQGFGEPLIFMWIGRFAPLFVVIKGLLPFEVSQQFVPLSSLLLFFFIVIVIRQAIMMRQERFWLLLSVFAVLEICRLALFRVTVFDRYFAPVQWVLLIFFGMGLGAFWGKTRSKFAAKVIYGLSLILSCFLIVSSGIASANKFRRTQELRHLASLKGIGLWLGQHSHQDATVLLEPIGYVGYYSMKVIFDEVGIVTPQVVEFKQQGVLDVDKYIPVLEPDHVVIHCDDAKRQINQFTKSGSSELARSYSRVVVFDPLRFSENTDQDMVKDDPLTRNACYEIWSRDSS